MPLFGIIIPAVMFLLSNKELYRKLLSLQALKHLPEPLNLLRWGLKAEAVVWLRKTAHMSDVSKTLQVIIPLLREIVAAFPRCLLNSSSPGQSPQQPHEGAASGSPGQGEETGIWAESPEMPLRLAFPASTLGGGHRPRRSL